MKYRQINKLISTIGNRRLRRKVSDAYYKLILSKDKWHLIDTLPEMQMYKNQNNYTVYFNKLKIGNVKRTIKATEKSELNLIGSGPSISNQDFSSLQDKPVILMNGTISLCSSYEFNQLYYVIIDSTFVANRFNLIKENIPDNANIFLTPGVLHCILEFDINFTQNRNVTIIENIQSKYSESQKSLQEIDSLYGLEVLIENNAGISLNIDNGYLDGGTVMYAAAQIALSLNPQSISFFGFDIGNSDQPRFNENSNDKLKSGILASYDKIVRNMAIFSKICTNRNIKIKNYSPVSTLPDNIIKKFHFLTS